MCGIAGVFEPEGRVDELGLERMTRALWHRGPDGQGEYQSGCIALCHRRLSVIDLEHGEQPFFAAGGRVALIANGEIYNFQPLRNQLRARGHAFRSQSDCEVLAHGYAEWGMDILQRIDGMFAFALWDARDQTLVLARDRLGEKPLYFCELPGPGLAFSSELRSLLCYPGVSQELDTEALALYLHREYVPAPHSMIRGVHKLGAGEVLIASARGHRIERYWSWPGDKRDSSLADEAAALEEDLRTSVRERLVADVPVGVFLSGGLDSSLVTALACEARPGDIDTFGVAFADPSYDESAHARRVAALLGTRHHECRVSASDLQDQALNLGALLDEPLGDASLVPTFILSRFARQHVTVALGGDGGDDLFSGYPTHRAEAVLGPVFDALAHRPARARRVLEAAAQRLGTSSSYMSKGFLARQIARGLAADLVERNQRWLASFAPEEIAALLCDSPIVDYYGAQRASDCASDRQDRLQRFYCEGYLGGDILAKVDRASMAVALEVRTPFLARAVVERAARMPSDHRYHRGTGKRILKRIAERYLPRDLVHRKKHGFAMPVSAWLRGDLRELLHDTLSPTALAQGGLFRPQVVAKLLDEHDSGAIDHRKPLWTLLAFQLWRDSLHRTGESRERSRSLGV